MMLLPSEALYHVLSLGFACELTAAADIALNFLVSHMTGLPPLWIQSGRITKIYSKLYTGKSSQPGWGVCPPSPLLSLQLLGLREVHLYYYSISFQRVVLL
jgi:hypothetical protein